MAISSRRRSDDIFAEPSIRWWQEAGLLKPSVLKPLIATIERRIIRRRLGRLQKEDQQALRQLLDEILG
jgi:mRNA interferase MazF